MGLMRSVIPGLTRNPVPFWIPAFAGMTPFVVINGTGYKNLKGEDSMRRYQKIMMTMALITIFISAGITLLNPIAVNGQSKGRTILSQEIGRDPFLLPSGVHLLSKTGTASGTKGGRSGTDNRPNEDLMKVKAILISDHVRLALIDRQIVAVGDSVHGEKVLEIKTDRVTLGKGDQKRAVLLSQSPVQLTVEERPPHSYPSPRGESEGRDRGEYR